MVVHNGTPQFFLPKQENGHQKTKWPPTMKLSITQSIFKPEAPDFAWQFIIILRIFCQKTKWLPKTKLSITQSIFNLEAPNFAW